MRQHITIGQGGTLTYIVRDKSNEVRFPDSSASASYSIFREDSSDYNDTATITGACAYGWTTDLASAHNATAGQILKLTSTAGIAPGDMLLLTHKTQGHTEQCRITNLGDGTTGRVRISRETINNYAASAKVENPVLEISLSSAQAESASLLGLDQHHRAEIVYQVNSQELREDIYFDVVRRWPRPPVLPIDIYEARPELRYEIPDTYVIMDVIQRAWDDVLGRIRAFGKLPQYMQNEEVMTRQLRALTLHYICRDIAQTRSDDNWSDLSDSYLDQYTTGMDAGLPLLRFDSSEDLGHVGESPNVNVVRFQRGGKGTRRNL
jgi:hypothetical protein